MKRAMKVVLREFDLRGWGRARGADAGLGFVRAERRGAGRGGAADGTGPSGREPIAARDVAKIAVRGLRLAGWLRRYA